MTICLAVAPRRRPLPVRTQRARETSGLRDWQREAQRHDVDLPLPARRTPHFACERDRRHWRSMSVAPVSKHPYWTQVAGSWPTAGESRPPIRARPSNSSTSLRRSSRHSRVLTGRRLASLGS